MVLYNETAKKKSWFGFSSSKKNETNEEPKKPTDEEIAKMKMEEMEVSHDRWVVSLAVQATR